MIAVHDVADVAAEFDRPVEDRPGDPDVRDVSQPLPTGRRQSGWRHDVQHRCVVAFRPPVALTSGLEGTDPSGQAELFDGERRDRDQQIGCRCEVDGGHADRAAVDVSLAVDLVGTNEQRHR